MTVSFEISEVFPVYPDELYSAWLDSETHTEMTGSKGGSHRQGDRAIQRVETDISRG